MTPNPLTNPQPGDIIAKSFPPETVFRRVERIAAKIRFVSYWSHMPDVKVYGSAYLPQWQKWAAGGAFVVKQANIEPAEPPQAAKPTPPSLNSLPVE